MKLVSFLCGALALPIAAVSAPVAGAASRSVDVVDDSPFEIFPLGVGERAARIIDDAPPVLLAQAGDPRVGQLEETVRQLTGRIEELNFQILQMQEGLRKMQEDVDFRLQDLEQKRGDAGGSGARRAEAPPAKSTEAPATKTPAAKAQGPVAPAPATGKIATAAPVPGPLPPAQGPGAPEKPLGALVLGADGAVKDGTVTLTPPTEATIAPDGDTIVAALPPSDNPQDIYRNAYEFILSGDYGTAEAGFRDHIAKFPNDPQAADAHYWLGEALLGQRRYRDAAEVFVAASRTYPDARKAPDTLLKLGVSMVALNQREVACATLLKVGQRYPDASATLKERVKQERALAGC